MHIQGHHTQEYRKGCMHIEVSHCFVVTIVTLIIVTVLLPVLPQDDLLWPSLGMTPFYTTQQSSEPQGNYEFFTKVTRSLQAGLFGHRPPCSSSRGYTGLRELLPKEGRARVCIGVPGGLGPWGNTPGLSFWSPESDFLYLRAGRGLGLGHPRRTCSVSSFGVSSGIP